MGGQRGGGTAIVGRLPAYPPPAQAFRLSSEHAVRQGNSGIRTAPAGRSRPSPRATTPTRFKRSRSGSAAPAGASLDVYTCRTTDFTCTTSPAMHQQVVALAAQGRSGQEIVDAFVRENGVAILMAPPKRGLQSGGLLHALGGNPRCRVAAHSWPCGAGPAGRSAAPATLAAANPSPPPPKSSSG